jgi:hypothetical protein
MPRTTARLLIPFLLVTGCAAWRHGGAPSGVGAVTGRVVDAQHVGVRGALVTVIDPAATPSQVGSASTRADGTFTIDKIPAARGLTVVASRPTSSLGVSGRKEKISVDGNRTTDVGEIILGVRR